MAEIKPFLAMLTLVLFISFILNVFIAPFYDIPSPVAERALEAEFIDDIKDGSDIVSSRPMRDFISSQAELWGYVPSTISIIVFSLLALTLLVLVLSMIRGN